MPSKSNTIVLLLFFVAVNLWGQEEKPRTFQQITTKEGLSSNVVYDVHQDGEGFMWMATNNGLNRYDGYGFKTFYNTSDTLSIASNIVRKIIEDTKGNLWIATKNGLNAYHKKKELFRRYNRLLENLDIQDIQLDKEEKVWYRTEGQVGYFDPKTRQFTAMMFGSFKNMEFDLQGHVWLTDNDGALYRIDLDSEKVINIGKDVGLIEQQIHYGAYSKQLWLPHNSTIRFKAISHKYLPKLPKNKRPISLMELDAHRLLIGTYLGLYEYNSQTKVLQEIHVSKATSSLTHQIRSLYLDQQNGIWVGTAGGVFHYDPYRKEFEHIDVIKGNDDVIMAMDQYQKGWFVNALGKGLYHSGNGTSFSPIVFPESLPNGTKFIWDIETIPESNYPVWMATGAGVFCYAPASEKIIEIPLPKVVSHQKESYAILNTKKDHVWLVSRKYIYQVAKKNRKVLNSFSLADLLKDSESGIQKIIGFQDHIFIATEGHGLFSFEKKTALISPIYVADSNKEKALFQGSIWDLYMENNTLWVGTNIGLYRWDANSKKLVPVISNNHVIFSIVSDGYNSLWMGTENGLMSYDLTTEKVHFYDTKDGIQNVEFNRKSVFKTAEGHLWFGGVNGITRFDPAQIKSNTIPPPVHITKIKVITSDTTYTVKANAEQAIVLPWNHNTVEFEYVGLNYTNSSQNQYKYQLVGRDPSWFEDQGLRMSRYVQLPAGSYTFQVLAANNDGIWNTKGAAIQLEILPPFWATWWFRSIVFIMIVLLVWSMHRYKVKRVLEVERMKLRIASDLHDEVGSGLSGIALTSDIVEQQLQNGGVKPHLISRITRNARHLAATLDDIVWLINPGKETLGDFLIKAKTVTQELLTNTEVTIAEDITVLDKERVLNPELKRNLLLFLKEGIHNIAKHAKATQVQLFFVVKDQKLIVRLMDDGSGFILENAVKGNGIQSMQHRAKAIKAILHIDSAIAAGTTLELIVKIP